MTKTRETDYWSLYRSLEKTIRDVEATHDPDQAIGVFLASLVNDYRTSLGIIGGRLYRREDDDYVLTSKVRAADAAGDDPSADIGYRIPVSYPIVAEVRREGAFIADPTNPAFDPAIEGPLQVDTFAAICAGAQDEWLISFSIDAAAERAHVLYCINTVRHVINWKLHQAGVEGELLHIQEIQRSLFPKEDPLFEGYDIHGVSRPSEAVGGDVYDFLEQGAFLGVLIADSSGHGLAAALQARDVITGMRMGVEKDLKITHAVEKLNRVIHRTSLSSKFVSLFYGELDRYGNFIYCNAGHVPVLRHGKGGFRELSKGGPVLGPSPRATYERGFTSLRTGDLLVLYTDGITEAHGPGGEEFDARRLKDIVSAAADRGAREIAGMILDAVDRFAPDDPLRDDRTVVVVRRTGSRPR